MYIIQVHCEWDLGIPEFYESQSLAEMYVRSAISTMEEDLEMDYDECIDEGYIGYETVGVVMEPL